MRSLWSTPFAAGILFRALSRTAAAMPTRMGYRLADLLVVAHELCFPARRRAALANLEVILPDSSPSFRRWLAGRMMVSYNRMLFEFLRFARASGDELLSRIRVEGLEHIEQARARGKGAIVTTGHIGNWELGAVALAQHGHRVHAVAGDQFGRWLAPAVRDVKRGYAVHSVSPADGFRKLFRALAANEIVALTVDGDTFIRGTPQPFFGRTVMWPAGPGILAERTGAAIVPGYCVREEPGMFRVVIEEPLDPDDFASADEINAAVAATTERHIRMHLPQWCIFRELHDQSDAGLETPDAAGRYNANGMVGI